MDEGGESSKSVWSRTKQNERCAEGSGLEWMPGWVTGAWACIGLGYGVDGSITYQRLGCTMQNTHAYQTPDLSGRDTPVRGWRLVRAITMFREVPAQLRLVFGKFNAVRS